MGVIHYQCMFAATQSDAFIDFYVMHLRGNLFSGYLTLAAFLLSAETFIIVHLQKEVYGRKAYLDQIREQRKTNPKLSLYGPLRRLNLALFAAVVMSLLAAVLQLTLGVVERRWAVWTCIGFATAALVPLGICVFAMGSAMNSWFNDLERDADTTEQPVNEKAPAAPSHDEGSDASNR